MVIDYVSLKQKVFETAQECAMRGPGYSQQRPVLDAVAAKEVGNAWEKMDLDLQQHILTCWYDLFREGDLSWGYDLNNPDAPFFHVPNRRNQHRSRAN